jgi:hypothetical protein
VSALLSLLTVGCCAALLLVVAGVVWSVLPLGVGVVYAFCLCGALVALWLS